MLDTQRVPAQNLRFCTKLAACLTKTQTQRVGTSSRLAYPRAKSVHFDLIPEFDEGSG